MENYVTKKIDDLIESQKLKGLSPKYIIMDKFLYKTFADENRKPVKYPIQIIPEHDMLEIIIVDTSPFLEVVPSIHTKIIEILKSK